MMMEPGEDLRKFTLRVDGNGSEQNRRRMEIPENMVNAYIINGLPDEYGIQRQLLDSENVLTRGNINSMMSIRDERL